MKWSVVYERATRPDGSLFFPERLTPEFLQQARRTMGSYLFANQYQNEIIPEEEKRFKPHWLRYHREIPDNVNWFAFIDPAIGQKNHHDYTGLTIIAADSSGDWHLKIARRERLTPTEIVELCFKIADQFPMSGIGIESVAYQEALLYFVHQESQRRQKVLPIKGIPRSNQSKETRILGLVPRFEYGRITLAQGLTDFEDEYNSFPRGTHDDILDALASLEELVFYPAIQEKKLEKPHSPADPNYERWYRQSLVENGGERPEAEDPDWSFG